MASDKAAVRWRYTEELKAEVRAECDPPGASVAQMATSRGLNANVAHRWRQMAREFVAVAIAPQPAMERPACCDIEVELRRGAVTMRVTWRVSAAADSPPGGVNCFCDRRS